MQVFLNKKYFFDNIFLREKEIEKAKVLSIKILETKKEAEASLNIN